MDMNRQVRVEGVINDEIIMYGLMKKAEHALDNYFNQLRENKVQPAATMPLGPRPA